MHSFFQFRAHGTTPRVIMMMASATSSSSLASCRAPLRRRRATALRHVMLFWKCPRCGEPTSPSVPSDALHRIVPRHPTRPRKMCDVTVLVKVIRCSHCMSAAGFTRELEKLMKKSSVFTRKTPSMYVSPVVIYRPLRCFAFLLSPMFFITPHPPPRAFRRLL